MVFKLAIAHYSYPRMLQPSATSVWTVSVALTTHRAQKSLRQQWDKHKEFKKNQGTLSVNLNLEKG